MRAARIGSTALVLVAVAVSPAQTVDATDRLIAHSPELRDYISATGLLNRGMDALAAAEYRKFLAAHPDHERAPSARYGLAVALYRQQAFGDAAVELAEISEVDDFEYVVESLAMLGQCQLATGELEPASKTLARFMRRAPDHELAPDVAVMQVEIAYRQGQHALVESFATAFLKRWPNDARRERVLLFAGLAAAAVPDWAMAQSRFEELLRVFPQTAHRSDAEFMLAQCHAQQNLVDQAIRYYRQVMERVGGSHVDDATLGLAELLYARGEYAEAEKLARQYHSAHPDAGRSVEATVVQGRCRYAMGAIEDAERIFRQLQRDEAEPADEIAYWLAKCLMRADDSPAAAKLLQETLKEHADSALAPELRYELAASLAQAGKLEDAIEAATTFRKRHSEHEHEPDIVYLLASLEHRSGSYERSGEYCTEFTRGYTDHELAPAIAFLAAENHYLAGDQDAALRAFAAFRSAYPEDTRSALATYRVGQLLYDLGRLDEAAEPLAAACAVSESDERLHGAHLLLGDVHYQKSEWDDARRALTEYIASGIEVPQADDALLKLGLIAQRQGRHTDAIARFEQIRNEFPDSPRRVHAQFESGQTHLANDDAEAARAMFESVLEDDDDGRFAPYALQHLGVLALRAGDHTVARGYLERLLDGTPDDALRTGTLSHLAQALLALHEYDRARDILHELARLDDLPGEDRARLVVALARRGEREEALGEIHKLEGEEWSTLGQDLKAAMLYEKAWCLRKLDRTDEARATYNDLLTLNTSRVELYHALLELAELELAAGHTDRALPRLEKLRTLAADGGAVPKGVLAQANLRAGIAQFEAKDYTAAATTLTSFVSTAPNHEQILTARFYCGRALRETGRHKQAAEQLKVVAEQGGEQPFVGPALLEWGECLAAIQNWPQCEEVFARHVREHAESEQWYQARFGLGWARENQGRLNEALAEYRQVVERHQGPTAARAQFQIGECLFAQKKLAEAARELLKVDILYAYPEWSAAALYEAGRCFEQLGQAVEARQQYVAVRDKYAESRWAELAAQRLTHVQSGGLPGRGG